MKILLIVLANLIVTFCNAQKKVVFSKGLDIKKIRVGKVIGITLKGEAFKYQKWKSNCNSQSDSSFHDNLWTLDSIFKNYIVVRKEIKNDSAYKFDTITTNIDTKRFNVYMNKWQFVGRIPDNDPSNSLHEKMIFRYPLKFIKQKISLDSIASFTFPKRDKCAGYFIGVPFLALFAIIGSPINAFTSSPHDIGGLILGETAGLLLVYWMYRHYKNGQVKTYSTQDYKIKIK